ncbi:MAG: hypothetical protein NZO58_06120 [Gemmataceae bacterium]|nr:hypothetical protein [Gemmataceae bacterium]
MMRPIFCGIICGLIAGCGASTGPTSTSTTAEAGTVIGRRTLTPARDVDLAALLRLPRAELAAKAAALEENLRSQEDLRIQGRARLDLLPQFHPAVTTPIWREASYSPTRGFSLPPYLKDGERDSELARHVALHGDVEAALELAAPGTEAELRHFALERNVPLEWTRLVGLQILHAELALAAGNVDGAERLLAIHRQLCEVLPAKALTGALGRTLLGRGLPTLAAAARAWRSARHDDLAEPAEAFLRDLGQPPAWEWMLPRRRDDLGRSLALQGEGRALRAQSSLRAVDLLALPVDHAHVESCFVFFGDDDRLGEVLLLYQGIPSDCHDVRHWVPSSERLSKSQPCVTAMLAPGNPYLSGFVRIQFSDSRTTNLPRDLGLLSLDRTFEGNRRLVAWKQHGPRVTVAAAKPSPTLPEIRTPARQPVSAVQLERDPAADIVSRVRCSLAAELGQPLSAVALPFWERHGPGRIDVGAEVVLSWSDGITQWKLILPADRNQAPALEAADVSGREAGQRLHIARALDHKERAARLAAKQPLSRLSRSLEWLTLGMSRSEVERQMPARTAQCRDIPSGLMATFAGQPTAPADAVARTLFATFDDVGRLAEIRIRYADHPRNKAGTMRKRLEALQTLHGIGATAQAVPAWPGDLPPRKGSSGQTFSWQDDLTTTTATWDTETLEIAVRDRRPDEDDHTRPRGPMFLPRGPGGVSLGMSLSELRNQGAQPHEGAWLCQSAAQGSHDMILVWCEGERVARIVARHRDDLGQAPGKALALAWGRDIATLGWPWRQDQRSGTVVSWATHDGATFFRMFVQEDNLGVHLLSEWRDLGSASLAR